MCLRSHVLLDTIAKLLSSGIEFHFRRLDDMPHVSQNVADHEIRLVIYPPSPG